MRCAALVLVLTAGLAACGSTSAPRAGPTLIAAQNTGFQAAVTVSDLAVGRQRFTFGLLDNNHPFSTPAARAVFFDLSQHPPRAVEDTTARFNYFSRGLANTPGNSAAFEIGGVYVTYPTFPHAGTWGAQVSFRYGGRERTLAVQFKVQRHSTTPAVGSPAPRSHNPTIHQLPATKLDSGRPPDDMHQISIAAALAQHKPLVVLFATAAFCTSRMCGPEIQTVEQVEKRFRGRVNFVHIEVYKNADYAQGPAPTFTQWHLSTEPWVFVVNRHGIIAAKFEGPTPAGEIVPAVRETLRLPIH